MEAKSHTLTNVLITTASLSLIENIVILNQFNLFLIYLGVVIGALLPDIDEPNSYIGKIFFFSSILISRFSKHRTHTHNILFWLVIALIAYYVINSLILFFIAIGAILHICEDSITNSGCNFALKPIIGKFALLPKNLRFKTSGKFERLIYQPIIIILLFLYVKVYFYI